jgi:short-subunit dehydrogenase
MKSSNEKKFTLITGASAGLGKALAEECARRGMNLILVSLPEDELHLLGASLRREYGVEVHCFEMDLTQREAPLELARTVLQRFSVNMLINNAGVGGSMPLEKASAGYIDNILQLNIRALCLLTYQFVPELKKHDRSYILNISSLAAFSPIPFKTVYPASKAFVYSYSRSLRAELSHTSVQVAVLNPGPILTNADVVSRVRKHGWWGRLMTLTPEWTARMAIRNTLRGRCVIIPGIMGKMSFLLMKLAPTGLRLFILTRILSQEVRSRRPALSRLKTPV